jgi:hypothetical protein
VKVYPWYTTYQGVQSSRKEEGVMDEMPPFATLRTPMDDRSRNLLECLVDTESFDAVLTTLAVIAHEKAEYPDVDKYEAKQWSRASERLVRLRDWCAEFGPGSGCR